MKFKVNLRDYLADQCGHQIRIDAPVHLNTDDLLECIDLPDEDEFDFDIHEVLAENRQIAHIWGTNDVQDVRPDLDDDQAWQVLRDVERRLDSQYGISWDTIEIVADELFGPMPERRWHGRIDVTITDTDGYGQDEVVTRLRDMAELLAKDMPDVEAKADEGSVRLAQPTEIPSAQEAQP